MRLHEIARRLRAAVLLLTTVLPSSAHAQGTGRSMDIDPSVRAAAMGLASNAVFWDAPTNHHGNPALLGYERGLRYEWGRTQLVPGLADDIYFTTNVVKLGGVGFGVALSGKPLGIGGIHLSYGESEGTDENGNPTGTFEAFEQVDSWSLGLSVARATEAIAVMAGHEPVSFSRYADVSFGVTAKHLEMQLAPLVADGHAETDAYDLGFLVRVSPTELVPGISDVIGLDLAYGWSDLSLHADPVLFPNSPPSEVTEHERSGVAGRIRLDWPGMAESMAGPAWLWEGFRPLLSVGLARDHARHGAPSSRFETDSDGWELTVANVFSLRGGRYEDPLGDIVADTDGWGIGLPIGRVAGVRYDFARFPQARLSGLEDLKRRAASVWIDTLRVWRLAR